MPFRERHPRCPSTCFSPPCPLAGCPACPASLGPGFWVALALAETRETESRRVFPPASFPRPLSHAPALTTAVSRWSPWAQVLRASASMVLRPADAEAAEGSTLCATQGLPHVLPTPSQTAPLQNSLQFSRLHKLPVSCPGPKRSSMSRAAVPRLCAGPAHCAQGLETGGSNSGLWVFAGAGHRAAGVCEQESNSRVLGARLWLGEPLGPAAGAGSHLAVVVTAWLDQVWGGQGSMEGWNVNQRGWTSGAVRGRTAALAVLLPGRPGHGLCDRTL